MPKKKPKKNEKEKKKEEKKQTNKVFGKKKRQLPGRESNPGLPRDRRRYLPLYYRGHLLQAAQICNFYTQPRFQAVPASDQ